MKESNKEWRQREVRHLEEEGSAERCFWRRRCCEAAVPGERSPWGGAMLALGSRGGLHGVPSRDRHLSLQRRAPPLLASSLILSSPDTISASCTGRGEWAQWRCRHHFLSGPSLSVFPHPSLGWFQLRSSEALGSGCHVHGPTALPHAAPYHLLHLLQGINSVLKNSAGIHRLHYSVKIKLRLFTPMVRNVFFFFLYKTFYFVVLVTISQP